jgi:DNA-binding NtrC family response regulator
VKPGVLLIEDEAAVRFSLQAFFSRRGYEVREAADIESGLDAFACWRPNAAVLDYLLPDGTALDLLPRLREIDPAIPLVILTGHGSIELAVQAIKGGAEHFLAKPVDLENLLGVVERAIRQSRERQERGERGELGGRHPPRTDSPLYGGRAAANPFLGASRAIRALERAARRMAAADSPLLLEGETGTGKGLLAHWLHAASPRRERPFVDVNCAGLSRELLEADLFGHERGAFTGAAATKEGLLEVAGHGTVFLDEMGDLDGALQPRLLKVIEEKRFRRVGGVRDRVVDVRLIAATHQPLARLVRDGRFRGDLYFRLSTLTLLLPPLRERPEDIPELCQALLAQIEAAEGAGGRGARRRFALTCRAREELQRYPWPGNVRELRNVLERATLLAEGDLLDVADLALGGGVEAAPAVFLEPRGFPEPSEPSEPSEPESEAHLTLELLERRHIERVLAREGGRVAAAAASLGVPRSSLYQKIKKLQLLR